MALAQRRLQFLNRRRIEKTKRHTIFLATHRMM